MKKNVLLVGVVRNCSKTIVDDIKRLISALDRFEGIQVLIVESDSSDATIEKLNYLKKLIPNFSYITLGELSSSTPLRTERIAYCRNVYLDEINTNKKYLEVDYIVISDLDGVNDSISIAGINSCFERNDWDVCAANSMGHYYDIWALRHDIWCPNDCWSEVSFLESYGVNKVNAEYSAVYSKMINIPANSPWISVDSAFGGLAIYRRSSLLGVEYCGIDKDNLEVCEHVSLHKQIKSKGKMIYINPRLINTTGTEHDYYFSFTKRLVGNMKKRLKALIKSLIKI